MSIPRITIELRNEEEEKLKVNVKKHCADLKIPMREYCLDAIRSKYNKEV